MANIDFNNYAGWDLPVYLNRLNPIPLDKTSIFYSYSEASTYALNVNLAYEGQILSVLEDNIVTVYKINANRELEPIGGGSPSSIPADNYTSAVTLATSDNIGQIIDVQNDYSEGEGATATTYTSGLYIVTGPGTISKLGVSSASGDISSDVENLKAKVAALEEACNYLYWETDEGVGE